MCLICGYVGCCDTSKNQHMHKHVEETDHPLIRSIEPGEGWIWCYPDEAFLSANSSQLDQPMPVRITLTLLSVGLIWLGITMFNWG